MAPAPLPQPWIDPETWAMLQQILSEGGDPMLDGADVYAQPWIGPQEDKTPGTLEAQNAMLTALGKANTRFMDPSMILSLGNSMGGAGPEAYEPVTTYKAITAQGQLRLKRMLESKDPFERTVATLADQGMGSGAIQAEIQRILSSPDDPLYEPIRASIPGTLSTDVAGKPVLDPEQPDYAYVSSTISSLTDALASDTGTWDRETLDETGAPAMAVQEDSEMMKALREAGFTNTPYETYDPYSFAPEGVTPETDLSSAMMAQQLAGKAKEATSQSGTMNRALAKAMMGDKYNYNVPLPMPSGENPAPQRGAWDALVEEQMQGAPRAMPSGELTMDPKAKQSRSPARGMAGQIRRRNDANQLDVDGIRSRSEAANRESMKQFGDSRQAAAAMLRAQAAAGNRQQLVEDLMRAGFSPFADQNRARQANIWGG